MPIFFADGSVFSTASNTKVLTGVIHHAALDSTLVKAVIMILLLRSEVEVVYLSVLTNPLITISNLRIHASSLVFNLIPESIEGTGPFAA